MAFRAKVRAFVDAEVTPNCDAWDRVKAIPRELFAKAFAAGLLPGVVGPPWPVAYAGPAPEVRMTRATAHGAKARPPVRALTQRHFLLQPPRQGFDAFHELILIDEICRCGSGGVVWGLVEGLQARDALVALTTHAALATHPCACASAHDAAPCALAAESRPAPRADRAAAGAALWQRRTESTRGARVPAGAPLPQQTRRQRSYVIPSVVPLTWLACAPRCAPARGAR